MSTLPTLKNRIKPLRFCSMKRDKESLPNGLIYACSPYTTMNFKPNTTKNKKEKWPNFENKRKKNSFEDYLIDNYKSFNDEKLRKLNEPAFALLKKKKRAQKMQKLGIKFNS